MEYLKDLKVLSNKLKTLSEAVKENKQDSSHVLYNLDKFLIEKDYMEDNDIYIIFHNTQDTYCINDAYGMIEDLKKYIYPQFGVFKNIKIKDATIDKLVELVEKSENLIDTYSGTQSGVKPYLHFDAVDLFVGYVSTRRAYLFLRDFKKDILELEKERETPELYI